MTAPLATTPTPFHMSRIGRHGLIYGTGVILSKAVAFVMLPVYTRYLTPADYGVLQLIDMVVEVASIVAGSRLGAGIFRYYHKAETPEQRRAVLSTALIVILTSYAAAATAMYFSAPAIARVALGDVQHVALVRIADSNLRKDRGTRLNSDILISVGNAVFGGNQDDLGVPTVAAVYDRRFYSSVRLSID